MNNLFMQLQNYHGNLDSWKLTEAQRVSISIGSGADVDL
jgi:hypothetical protein